MKEMLTPGYIGLGVALLAYFVRSSIDIRSASRLERVQRELVEKIDELKTAITALTVGLARVEEKHSSLAMKVDEHGRRIEEIEHTLYIKRAA